MLEKPESRPGVAPGVDRREDAAVMFTDVAGFSALMERSEAEAMQVLAGIRTSLGPLLRRCGGRLVKEMGDSTLSVFRTPTGAVRCARELQAVLSGSSFSIRVGIHWGQVLIEESDVFGDTVNIASRLEQLSAPGGVCVSGEVMGQYSPRRRPHGVSLGLRRLKGLGRLVEVFALGGSSAVPLRIPPVEFPGAHPSEDGTGPPSIAITPFRNLGAPRDGFYAWSITSDLVSDLARAGSIRIAPLRDTTRLWELEEDAAALARRLHVRFVVTGTLWKRRDTFHLSIELVDARMGILAWSDGWQDDWRDLSAIKGKVADGLLKAIGIESYRYPWITGVESGAARAYEIYLRAAHAYGRRRSGKDVLQVRRSLEEAIAADPGLVPARLLLSGTLRDSGNYAESMTILEETRLLVEGSGDRGSLLRVLNGMGILHLHTSDFDEAQATFRDVLRLARQLGDLDGESRALNNLGLVEWNRGAYAAASARFRRSLHIAERLDDPVQKANVLCNIGLVCWSTGRNTEALDFYAAALRLLEEQENLAGQAHLLRNMGSVHLALGDVTTAGELARRTILLCRELGDRAGECRSLINLGNVKLSCGFFEEALGLHRCALEIARSLGDRVLESIGLLDAGLALMALDRREEAGESILRSLMLSRETGDAPGECEALVILGDLSLRSGRPSHAVEILDDAIRRLETAGMQENLLLARILLCLALLASDEPPTGSGEVAAQLVLAGEDLGAKPLPGPRVLWLFGEACRRLAAALPQEAPGLLARRKRILAKAVRMLRRRAGLILDDAARDSYLHRIPEHDALLGDRRRHPPSGPCP